MALVDIFTGLITRLKSIQVANPTVIPNANNRAKTTSTANQVFQYINIWDNQIDELIKGNEYPFNANSCFIEYIPGEAKMLLNNVSSFPDSKLTFHIFSLLLNSQGTDMMEQNLEIYGLRDKVKRSMNGFSPATGVTNFMCCEDKLDYKHGNVTKYLLSYNFNYIDTTGSVFDSAQVNGNYLAPQYLKSLVIPNLALSINQWDEWVGGINYIVDKNVVTYGSGTGLYGKVPNVYLCLNSNSDTEFTISNWTLIPSWKIKSWVVNDYCYYGGIVFICSIANSDTSFNLSNWIEITHG